MKVETRVGIFVLCAIGVFLYLSVNIRAFRFDKNQYHEYKAYFEDTGGITLKAPVKIAGVEVGWIEDIKLLTGGKAEVLLRVHRKNKLAKNAYAMIYQAGLIGTKTIEIDPGDPTTGLLLPGSALSMPGKTPTSVGELLEQFRDIATSIQDVAGSFKSVFASRKGEDNMKLALNSVAKASDRIADFSLKLKDTMARNEENINVMLTNFKHTAHSFRQAGPKVKGAFEQVEDASIQARDTFKEAGQVMEKINTGKGVVGKLINEDETYGDLKKTIKGFKNYVSRTQSLMLNVDMHAENMLRQSNSKGYFELKLRPNSDCFYLVQLVADEKGRIRREEKHIIRKDDKGNVLKASEENIAVDKKIEFADQVDTTVRTKNDILFGLQFGKRFDRLAFRIGLFESTFGVGCDYYVPLGTDKFHWITTLEAFDMRGVNRLNDTRPHLKWLNKLFFMKNLYTSFGVDDIVSKSSANPFFGGGLRFGDDDLKYFMSMLPVGRASQ